MGLWHKFVGTSERCERCGDTRFGGFHPPPPAHHSHAYRPANAKVPWYQTRCAVCRGQPGESQHLYHLPGLEDIYMRPEVEPEDEPEPMEERKIEPDPQMGLFQ